MTRKTLSALKAEVLNLIPDNVTGLVSPLDIRTVLDNAIDSLNTVVAMAYGAPNSPIALTATPSAMPATFFTVALNDDLSVIEGRITPNGDVVTHTTVGQVQLSFDVTFTGTNNVEYAFYLARNGALLPPVVRDTARGATNPVSISFDWVIFDPAVNDSFKIYLAAPGGASSPTITGCAIRGTMYPTVS